MHKVSAILLAAGLSSRMNGPNKLILPFQEGLVIQSSYKALSSSTVTEIIVVTGRDADLVKSSLSLRPNDQFAHNEHFEAGMTSSIQSGLRAMESSNALMVCLGDMPLLSSVDYDLLIKTFQQDGARDKILVPWFKGNRANPVIFGCDYFDEIFSHKLPNGCAGIIKNHSEKVLNLQVDNERFIRDIDNPEDFQQLESNAE